MSPARRLRTKRLLVLCPLLCLTSRVAAQGAAPTDRTLLSSAIGALLQADGARATRLLDSIGRVAVDSAVRRTGACMADRLSGIMPPSTEPLPTIATYALARYRAYWRAAILQPGVRDSLEVALMHDLRARLTVHDSLPTEQVERTLTDSLAHAGVHALTGRTGVLRELMLWRTQRDTLHALTLPDGAQTVRVRFLDGFESLGWSSHVTCNRAGTGGWTRDDGLYVVVPNYRSTTDEAFRVNFLAHEGQHFLDKSRLEPLLAWELEYRAKLVELAMADSTRRATLGAFARAQGTDPRDAHAFANRAVLTALRAALGRETDDDLQTVDRQELADAALAILRRDTATRRRRD